jgi:glycosyltransferase involved in cell wall biosynthesis
MRKTVEAKTGKLERYHVLYYGTDISRFNRTQKPDNQDYTFLQISSFAEKKGHIYTIHAFAKFLKDNPMINAKLQFAGIGEYFEAMKALVTDLKLDRKVEFLGAVNQDRAKQLLEQANCFLHHSITAENGDMEGIPNAIMEAMAMQLPIISTKHSGIPELIEDGVNGFLVAEKDVNDYALNMKKILSWGLKPENRVVVETKFERNKHVTILETIYTNSQS